MTPSTDAHTDQVAIGRASRSLEFRLVADPFWLSPLRAMVHDAALHAGLDLEAAADLTMAVDEAVALLIDVAAPHDHISGELEVGGNGVRACLSLPGGRELSTGTFSWRVLATLTDEVVLLPGGAGIQLVKGRTRPHD
jgi:serine/threonine-protein kinase RsbW